MIIDSKHNKSYHNMKRACCLAQFVSRDVARRAFGLSVPTSVHERLLGVWTLFFRVACSHPTLDLTRVQFQKFFLKMKNARMRRRVFIRDWRSMCGILRAYACSNFGRMSCLCFTIVGERGESQPALFKSGAIPPCHRHTVT